MKQRKKNISRRNHLWTFHKEREEKQIKSEDAENTTAMRLEEIELELEEVV